MRIQFFRLTQFVISFFFLFLPLIAGLEPALSVSVYEGMDAELDCPSKPTGSTTRDGEFMWEYEQNDTFQKVAIRKKSILQQSFQPKIYETGHRHKGSLGDNYTTINEKFFGRVNISEEGELILRNSTVQDSGNYKCYFKGHTATGGAHVSLVDLKVKPFQEGEWDKWSDWGQCCVEGFQIRRRECKTEPCVGEQIQERKCEPTASKKCKGLVDVDSWDEWSVCECNHELNLSEGSGLGVKYRIHKCRRECPTVLDCPNTVQYETCSCQSNGVQTAKPKSTSENAAGEIPTTKKPAAACVKPTGYVVAIFVLFVLLVLCVCYIFKRKYDDHRRRNEQNPSVTVQFQPSFVVHGD
ncbi:netrin receptor UNC5B-a-like isoform X1 [Oculina patagonica]